MEQMTQAEHQRANALVSPDSSIREKAAREFASRHAYELDTSDYHARGWNGAYSGYIAGYEQAMKDAEKLKD